MNAQKRQVIESECVFMFRLLCCIEQAETNYCLSLLNWPTELKETILNKQVKKCLHFMRSF